MKIKSRIRILVGLLVAGLSAPAAAQPPFLELLDEALAEIRAVRDAALTRVDTYALETKALEVDVLTCASTGPLIAHATVTPKAFAGASGTLRATPQGAVQPSLYAVLEAKTLTFGAAAGESLRLEVRGEMTALVTVRSSEGAGPPCVTE